MRTPLVVLLLLVATAAHADRRSDPFAPRGEPAPFEPRVEPETARWISLGTTAAGLGMTAYLWHHADGLEEGYGRAETQLLGIGTGLATIALAPASGLLVAGEYRRSVGGALARPSLVAAGGLAIGMGAFVGMWGCFETNDCAGAKITAGVFMGLGALAGASGLAWAAYDIWDTPRILRRRMPRRGGAAGRTTTAVAPLLGSDRLGVALTIVR
jgi:hypothetical protein